MYPMSNSYFSLSHYVPAAQVEESRSDASIKYVCPFLDHSPTHVFTPRNFFNKLCRLLQVSHSSVQTKKLNDIRGFNVYGTSKPN